LRRFFKDSLEHLTGQFPGLRVLVGGMIRSQQDLPVRHLVLCGMLENVGLLARKLAAPLEVIQIGIEANPA